MAAALEKGCVSPQIVDRMKRVRQPILIVFMAASFVNAFPLQTPAFFGLSRLQQRLSAAAGPQFIGSSSNWQLHFAVNDESNADASMTAGVSIELTEKQAFPDAEFLEFVLEEHRPLGCTVEESLAHPKEKFVFVSKVTEGGFAQQSGVRVGDVLVAVSGIFGDLTPVMGTGIEQVRSLVTGVPKGEPLSLRVARGTNVLDLHESALVDLCMSPGANDEDIENCVLGIMSHAYEDDIEHDEENNMMGCDSDTECLLDDMFAMWDEDMPTMSNGKDENDSEAEGAAENEIKPWSSRSSPSGTFVRDPSTGKMVNIDK